MDMAKRGKTLGMRIRVLQGLVKRMMVKHGSANIPAGGTD
jgi:hypothetical protein